MPNMQNKNNKIPMQTLLGGEMHNLAYITPMESQVLRSMGGGITPSGGQMMSNGVPAYQNGGTGGMPGHITGGMPGYMTGGSAGSFSAGTGGGAGAVEAAQRRAKEEAIKQALRDQTTAFNRQANYANNPASNIVLDRYKSGDIRFKTPTGQTIQGGAFTGVNSGIPIHMPGVQTVQMPPVSGMPNKYKVSGYDPVGEYQGAFESRDYGTFDTRGEADAELARRLNIDYAAGRIDPETGKYIDPRTGRPEGEEGSGSTLDTSASQVGLNRFNQSGNPQDLLLSGAEGNAAVNAFRAGLLAEQQANPLPNAGISLLQSGLIS